MGFWHSECYKIITHQTNINSSIKRFNKIKKSSDIPLISNVKLGRRPKHSPVDESESLPSRAQRTVHYNKELCIFCQEDKEDELHQASSKPMDIHFNEIAQGTNDDVIRSRLSILLASEDPVTVRAYDMKYHLLCFIKNQRIAQRPSNENAEELNIINVMCDLEIIDVVKWSLTDNEDTVLTMNDIQTAYLDILRENSIKIVEGKRYKPYLKQLIIDNIENVHFNKPNDITKSEQVFSETFFVWICQEQRQSTGYTRCFKNSQ